MIQEKLKQIDTGLIELLGKRIAVLAESEFPSLDHVIDSLNTLLAAREVEQQVEAKIYDPYIGSEKCAVLKKLSSLARLPMN